MICFYSVGSFDHVVHHGASPNCSKKPTLKKTNKTPEMIMVCTCVYGYSNTSFVPIVLGTLIKWNVIAQDASIWQALAPPDFTQSYEKPLRLPQIVLQGWGKTMALPIAGMFAVSACLQTWWLKTISHLPVGIQDRPILGQNWLMLADIGEESAPLHGFLRNSARSVIRLLHNHRHSTVNDNSSASRASASVHCSQQQIHRE